MRIAAVVLVTLVCANAAAAQEARGRARPAPERIIVTFVQLKPDKVEAWDTIMREQVRPAVQKAGVPWQQVWSSGAFGDQHTRVVLHPLPSYGELDGATPLERALGTAAAARIDGQLRDAILESRTMAMTKRPELSIESGDASSPVLLHVSFRQTHPGKAAEFVDVMKADFLPNFRRTGITDYRVYQVGFGGPNGLFMIVRPIPNYAALEEPSMMSRTLGADASAPAYARFNPLQSNSEFDVFKYAADLSFATPGGER